MHNSFLVASIVAFGIALSATNNALAGGATTSLQTEYLMTLHATLEPPQAIYQNLLVVNAPTGGWVEGPRIKGTVLAPAGDWLRVMPSGVLRLDVRGTIKTDDGELIYISYNGVIQCNKEQSDRLNKGEELKTEDCYFLTAPTFQTKSAKYGWLNGVQAVGKMVSLKGGDHVRYDIFTAK
jgi:hypothetical protein